MQPGPWCSNGAATRFCSKKAPPTVAHLVIHFEPEPHWQGSGSFVLRGGGGSRELAVALLWVHTPSKNPRPLS